MTENVPTLNTSFSQEIMSDEFPFGCNVLFVKHMTFGERWFMLGRCVWGMCGGVPYIGQGGEWHAGEGGVGHVVWIKQIVWDRTCCVCGMVTCYVGGTCCARPVMSLCRSDMIY